MSDNSRVPVHLFPFLMTMMMTIIAIIINNNNNSSYYYYNHEDDGDDNDAKFNQGHDSPHPTLSLLLEFSLAVFPHPDSQGGVRGDVIVVLVLCCQSANEEKRREGGEGK